MDNELLKINKIWEGTYFYTDKRSPECLLNKSVDFTISIDLFDGQKFKGIVEDNLSQGGTPGKGTIQGQFYGRNIEFIKKMPVSVIYLMHSGERIVNPNKKHKPIYYKGQIDEKLETAEGLWKLNFYLGFIKGGLAFGFPLKGKWTLRF